MKPAWSDEYWQMSVKRWWNDDQQGETEKTGKKLAQLLLHRPQMSHKCSWD
jgi:hypothetical protein